MADSKNVEQLLSEIKATSDELRHNTGEFKSIKAKIDEDLAAQLKEITGIKEAVALIETKFGRPGSPVTVDGKAKWKEHIVELVRKGAYASEEAKNYGAEALKSYGIANDTQGGYLVPPEFVNQIIEVMANSNPILGLAWKITTSREVVQIPKESGAPTAYWIGDTQTRSDAQGTHKVGLEEIKIGTLQSYVDMANTLLSDTPFDIEGFISRKIAEYQDSIIGKAFIDGAGPNSPEGMLTNSSVGAVASGDASKITADGLLSMGDDLNDAYDVKASFIMSKKTRSAIRRLKDTTNNYIWQPALTQGAPQTIDGVPIVKAYNMPAIASNAYPVIYGDVGSAYMVAQRVGMTMVRDELTQKTSGMTRFYFETRIGGQVVNASAISKLKIAASV